MRQIFQAYFSHQFVAKSQKTASNYTQKHDATTIQTERNHTAQNQLVASSEYSE